MDMNTMLFMANTLNGIVGSGDPEAMKDKYVIDKTAKNNIMKRDLATTGVKAGVQIAGNLLVPGLGQAASTILSPFIDKISANWFGKPMKKAQDYEEIQSWINQV